MSESCLIAVYVAELAAQLPEPVVAELADGLGETHDRYLREGLDSDTAARAAIAEFGPAPTVIAAFTQISPAQRIARRLMCTGPLVGALWVTALITGRAWTWPVQPAAVILAGVVLLATIAMIVSATTGRGYRSVFRAGLAGCVGVTALDLFLVVTVTLTAPAVTGITGLALAASLTRLTLSARSVHWCLAGSGLSLR